MAFTIWNSADKAGTLTLSGGDLTVISTSTVAGGIRSALGVNSGKYYWEITVVTRDSAEQYFGAGDSTAPLATALGYSAEGYAYTGWGNKRNNNVSSSYGDAYYAGDIISVALDMDAGKIWFANNGVWQASGNPEAGTGEAFSGISGMFYAMNSIWKLNDSFTANFGATAFAYSVPSGFMAGLGSINDIIITAPMVEVEGFTGIDARGVVNPSMSVSGFTGIDARSVTSPLIQVEGFTGIYSAPSIPMQTVIMTGSDNMIHTESFITIPLMSVKVTQAKQIWGDISAPMMTAEITERETVLSDITLPMMTVELSSGIHADLEAIAPMMSSEGLFSGQCEVTLPMMAIEIEGIVGRVISSDISLPIMTVEIEGKTEHLVNCDVATPMLRVGAELISGKIIVGAATVPMMEAALTSYEEITGDINASVPMPEAYMIGTTEREACTVLRYSEPDL